VNIAANASVDGLSNTIKNKQLAIHYHNHQATVAP